MDRFISLELSKSHFPLTARFETCHFHFPSFFKQFPSFYAGNKYIENIISFNKNTYGNPYFQHYNIVIF